MKLENTWRRIGNLSLAAFSIYVSILVSAVQAQDDVTTQNASSAIDGGWITGAGCGRHWIAETVVLQTFPGTVWPAH